MNLNIKNIVLILIAVMLASFLMAGLLGATTSPFWGWTNPAVEPIDETREFSADTIKEIDIETISSDINFRLDTVSGKVDSEFPLMVTSNSGRNFVGAVGDSDNRMQVKSVSGNVNIFQQ
ncbi:MAG: hypothetical protein KGZ63_04130 [Clostridiales bacterium]|jgi:ABC-type glycerol-3-phosphate transport system substrate-binding protein|nr:hypothetical protein [Clostridiales bacterium]